MAAVVPPALFAGDHLEALDERAQLALLQAEAGAEAVARRVAAGRLAEDQQAPRGKDLGEHGEQFALQVIGVDDQVPRTGREGLFFEVQDQGSQIEPGGLGRPAGEIEADLRDIR